MSWVHGARSVGAMTWKPWASAAKEPSACTEILRAAILGEKKSEGPRAGRSFEENGMWVPPCFIVVCNNTAVSQLVFQYIAGYEKPAPEGGTVVVPGKLPLFSNTRDGRWLPRPSTILVDSAELESGGAMRDDVYDFVRKVQQKERPQ